MSAVFAYRDVNVSHIAVEIGALSGPYSERFVLIGVDLDLSADHVDEFFAFMLTPVLELIVRAGLHPHFQRNHALARDLTCVREIVVLLGRERYGLALRGLGFPSADADFRARRYKLFESNSKALADSYDHIEGGLDLSPFDLGQVRDGNPGTLADLGQRQADFLTNKPQPFADCMRRRRCRSLRLEFRHGCSECPGSICLKRR